MTALLGGHVDMVLPSPAEVVEQVRAGKARILAVNSEKRLEIWPDVPTMKELGIPYIKGMIRGVMMPKDVPADAVKYWETAFGKMRQTEGWKKYVKEGALEEAWLTSAEFTKYLAEASDGFKSTMSEMGLLKK